MIMQYENKELHSPDSMSNWQQHVTVSESLPTPYSTTMNPPPMAMMPDGSPEGVSPSPFGFTFTAGMGSSGPESLHFSSDDEGGSPYPQQRQTSRGSSRPPTSNPSPNLVNLNKPRAQTLATVSPTSHPQEVPSQRPRMQSQHQSSTSAPQRPELRQSRSSVPFSPGGETVDHLYEYFPLGLEDMQQPVDAIFRPHLVHHEAPMIPDTRSPSGGRGNKRYFSEVA